MTQIDFRTLPANVPSLCIPRVYPNIRESRIRKIFDDLNMGTLERIDIVPKTSEKGDKFNRVFVHFRRWNDSENANTARERLLNGKEIKIIYDDPWFWKISAYREAERKSAPQQHPSGSSRKATLAFDSDEDKSSRPAYREERRRDDRKDDRRRADSRERPRRDDRRDNRRDDRRRDDRRNKNDVSLPDYRRFTTGYPAGHPANDIKKESQEKPVRKFIEERTPSNSPQRERPNDINVPKEPITVNYGNIIPPLKKRGVKKAEQKFVIEKEDGEVIEEDKNTETA